MFLIGGSFTISGSTDAAPVAACCNTDLAVELPLSASPRCALVLLILHTKGPLLRSYSSGPQEHAFDLLVLLLPAADRPPHHPSPPPAIIILHLPRLVVHLPRLAVVGHLPRLAVRIRCPARGRTSTARRR
eukprot:5898883-Heterocapsa_arctica.AAC.1